MKVTAKLSPQQSAPVDRVKVADQSDLLAELSEETLSGIVASVSIECIRLCFCAAAESDE